MALTIDEARVIAEAERISGLRKSEAHRVVALMFAEAMNVSSWDEAKTVLEVDRISLHEAGHAVVAHRLGQRVLEIRYRPEAGIADVVYLDKPPMPFLNGRRTIDVDDWSERAEYERQVIYTLAGMAAEWVFLGELDQARHAGGEDDNRARQICIAMSDTVEEARWMCAWLYERAVTIARANQDTIRAVADALIERHSLDTEAFERILGREAAGTS